jgi:hypothetical protein
MTPSVRTFTKIAVILLVIWIAWIVQIASAKASPVARRSVPARIAAFRWAVAQRGKPYEWGGTGPGAYDCSGLVMMAYRQAGISLPRTTWEMMADTRQLRRTWTPHKGDLAFFFGGSHVELYQQGSLYYGVAFGAHDPGTPVGWDTFRTRWTGPIMFYTLR